MNDVALIFGMSETMVSQVVTCRDHISEAHNSELDEFIIHPQMDERHAELVKNTLDTLIDMILGKTTGKTILV